MRAVLGLHGLQLFEAFGVEDGDQAGRADRDVQAVAALVVHDDVRRAPKRQPRHGGAATREGVVDDNELPAVRGAEEPAADQRESVGALGTDLDPVGLRQRACVDGEEDRGTLDRDEHTIARRIEDGPPGPPGKRGRGHDVPLIDGHDRGGAAGSRRIAEVEAVEVAAARIEREAIRPRPDVDPPEKLLVGAPPDRPASEDPRPADRQQRSRDDERVEQELELAG